MEDITFYTKMQNALGIILSIDFEKVFDSVNWKFLFRTLENINLGNNFIDYVKTMYNKREATVAYLKLERGARQGCPLSLHIFSWLPLKP